MRQHVRRYLALSLTALSGISTALMPAAKAADPPMRFTDVTVPAGIAFQHVMGDDQMSNIVEASGVGCAWLDFDGDGWLDIYLVNGVFRDDLNDGQVADKEMRRQATDRLYRNRGDGTFEDVTERAGILPGGYGMGVAVADYDDDGRRDLYVTNYGPNRLYHNLGDGRFEEVAEKAGVADSGFSVGSTFVDYDGDGRLDLYVGNYLDYVPDFNTRDGFPGPTAYQGQVNRLYRNVGGGGFQDVTQEAGFDKYPGHTMGVGIIDYNDDGRWDLFVANDAMENFLFDNKGNGQFEENALLANVAYGADGDARGSMGAEVGDANGDGRFDLFVPDFTLTCLYINQGDGFFDDQAQPGGHRPGLLAICFVGCGPGRSGSGHGSRHLRLQRRRAAVAGSTRSAISQRWSGVVQRSVARGGHRLSAAAGWSGGRGR